MDESLGAICTEGNAGNEDQHDDKLISYHGHKLGSKASKVGQQTTVSTGLQ